jgi:hypothetical protein
LKNRPEELFAEIVETELDEVTTIWQEAFEWSTTMRCSPGLEHRSPNQGPEKVSGNVLHR